MTWWCLCPAGHKVGCFTVNLLAPDEVYPTKAGQCVYTRLRSGARAHSDSVSLEVGVSRGSELTCIDLGRLIVDT